MIDTLNFGKYINSKLKGLAPKVSPLVVDNDTQFPYIIYGRSNLVSSSVKDGYYEDTVTIDIRVVSATYQNSLDIVNKVRDALERQEDTYGNMTISDSYITSATERYSNNAYIQDIQITFKVS